MDHSPRRVGAALVLLLCMAVPAGADPGVDTGIGTDAVNEYWNQGAGPVPVQVPNTSTRVEIIVNPALYGQVGTGLQQYVNDLAAQGYTATVTSTSFGTPSAVRSHLAGRYAEAGGLAGAVLVGDLPVPEFEISAHGDWSYQRFPCDLYYQDLDGTWSDADADGIHDAHVGNTAPEVWVGRLTASPVTGLHGGRTEAGLVNGYLAKNHAYRARTLSTNRNGLSYIDDDWIPWASSWSNALNASVEGSVTCVSNGATTTADDYESRLDSDAYESLLVAVHSGHADHSFKIGDQWTGGHTYNTEIAGLNPEVLFYNLFACSNADFSAGGCMGCEYLFGTDAALVAVGSTKTGSMLCFSDYYDPLGDGKTFGEAWQAWWLGRAAGGFSQSEMDWHYGMTFMGDPLLVTQPFIPEPATLALVAAGGLGLLARRRRR